MRTKFGKIVMLLFLFMVVPVSNFERRHVLAFGVDEPKDVVIFCVSSAGPAETTMQPVLIIGGGKYVNPVAGDSDAADLTAFASKYYGANQKYRLLFGGGDAGFVTVIKATTDSECSRTGALIKLTSNSGLKLNRNVMALATNSEGLGQGKSTRRAPTPAERAEAIQLAKKNFASKGTPAAIIPTIEVVNLTAMDFDGDGKTELVGTFVVKKTKGDAARYVLFMIAEPQGSTYQATLTNLEKFTAEDIMSGGSLDSIGADGIYTERLVDVIDVDSDGTSEVMSITIGFEGDTFKLYKKQQGKWNSVYEFGSYRCAF